MNTSASAEERCYNVQLLEKAMAFAQEAHKGQMYGKEKNVPYTAHTAMVERVLRRFGFTDEALLAAAWLHDTVEDTATTLDQIRAEFGDRVHDLVWAATNEPGRNRKERHALTYPKIVKVDGAVNLKLADRIANVEFSISEGDYGASFMKMYKSEYEGFKAALQPAGGHPDMWKRLDELLGG